MIAFDKEGKVVGDNFKLHLGCFNRYLTGWLNVDCRPQPETMADLVDDVVELNNIRNNSVERIYVCHVCEHFTREESQRAFKRWHEVLMNGGLLRISVPNLTKVMEHYMFYRDLRYLQNMLYGSQRHFADFHRTGWDFITLKEDLEQAGFKHVQEYDHKKTEHSHVDDYSAAYFPHMDFDNGTCMSLNVECRKIQL